MRKMILSACAIIFISTLAVHLNCAVMLPPPIPPEEMVIVPPPYPDAVRVNGHWQWRRWQHRYVWVPGHWKVRRHGVWVIVR